MMSREHFTEELRGRFRFVIQKMERERDALDARYLTTELRTAAIEAAQNNTDAAIDQLSDHVFDAVALSLEP